MCRLCGREACAECYRKLSSIPPSITPATAPKDRRDPEKRLIACVPRESHSHEQFFPISRFSEPELRAAVLEMSAILSDEKHTDTSRERSPATGTPELRYPAPPLDANHSLANLDLLASVVATLPHLPDNGRTLPPPDANPPASSPLTPVPLAVDQGTRPPPAPPMQLAASNVMPFVKVEPTPHDIDVATTSLAPPKPMPASNGIPFVKVELTPHDIIDVATTSLAPPNPMPASNGIPFVKVELTPHDIDVTTTSPTPPKQISASNGVHFVKMEPTPHEIDVTTTSSTSEPVSSPLLPISPSTSASELSRDTQIPKLTPALSATPVKSEDATPHFSTITFSDSMLTEEIFRSVWAEGHPLVVKGVLEKFHLKWTPEYFVEKYGDHGCTIVDCVTETKREVTVGWFFALFGNYNDRVDSRVWKLKDWPSSADFKTAFPELYDDFARAVPIPSYCRRDGVLNIASHFPSNAVAPDLGTLLHTLVRDTDRN